MRQFMMLLAVLLITTIVAAPAAQRAYSAVGDFSAARNPNGVWSYWGAGLLTRTNRCGPNTICRWNGRAICNSVIVGRNLTPRPARWLTIVLPPDHLLLDPEAVPTVTVRFTTPLAGTYRITGDFLGVDTTGQTHAVWIRDNTRMIYTQPMSRFGQRDSFNLTRKLAKGETINFISTTGVACTYLGTGLSAKLVKL